MITRRSALGMMLASAPSYSGAWAAPNPIGTPVGKPILTISGKITGTNDAGEAVFDLGMLEAMEQASIRTSTPWFTGPMRFDGVPMTRLMQAVGATGSTLIVSALNDYMSEIPIADFAEYDPILAIKRNGEYMPVRDKGPLFIIYPYDSSPDLNKQKYYSRSPWQIARMWVA